MRGKSKLLIDLKIEKGLTISLIGYIIHYEGVNNVKHKSMWL